VQRVWAVDASGQKYPTSHATCDEVLAQNFPAAHGSWEVDPDGQ
jgi:hypothetical protein